MTADLAAFLTARLDKIEQVARAARDAVDRDWEFIPVGRYNDEWALHDDAGGLIFIADRCPPAVGVHIALHDPAFARADVAAKKAILKLHGSGHECAKLDETSWAGWFGDPAEGFEHCDTLRLLAQPFRDHPEWSTEWDVK